MAEKPRRLKRTESAVQVRTEPHPGFREKGSTPVKRGTLGGPEFARGAHLAP